VKGATIKGLIALSVKKDLLYLPIIMGALDVQFLNVVNVMKLTLKYAKNVKKDFKKLMENVFLVMSLDVRLAKKDSDVNNVTMGISFKLFLRKNVQNAISQAAKRVIIM